jgi:hypothetical protein
LACVAAAPAPNDGFDGATRLLVYWPESAESLFDAARNNQGKRRAIALYSTYYALRKRNKEGAERFLEARMPDLLSWIDDRETAAAALSLLVGEYYYPPPIPGWLRRHRVGADAPVVEACRRILDMHPGKEDYRCLSILMESDSQLDSRDADRVAAALERALKPFQENFERTRVAPQGSLAEVHALLFDRLTKYSDRPAVRSAFALRRELEGAGILVPPRKNP